MTVVETIGPLVRAPDRAAAVRVQRGHVEHPPHPHRSGLRRARGPSRTCSCSRTCTRASSASAARRRGARGRARRALRLAEPPPGGARRRAHLRRRAGCRETGRRSTSSCASATARGACASRRRRRCAMPDTAERLYRTMAAIRGFETSAERLLKRGRAHRQPPPVDRAGGRRRRRLRRAARERPASRRRTAATATAWPRAATLSGCSPSCSDARPATAAARRARCTSPTRPRASSGRPRSSAAASRWRPARRSPPRCSAATTWRWRSSARAPWRRAASTRRSTSRRSGGSRSCSCCENNGYAELTHVAVHLRAAVHRLAEPHGIPGVLVDGNDVLAVREAADAAVARARAGEGPTLLECTTYRWSGHYVGDPERYRSKDEVAAWRERDPLAAPGGGARNPARRGDRRRGRRRAGRRRRARARRAGDRPGASLMEHVWS